MEEIETQLDYLDQRAMAELGELFEKKHPHLSMYDCIAALSRLYCAATTEPDLRLPMKPYKFIQSSWLRATTYQIVNEGLSVLNIVYNKLDLLVPIYRSIANSVVKCVHCAITPQDVPLYILVGSEFITDFREGVKLLHKFTAMLKGVIDLTYELLGAINDAFLGEELRSALADTLNSFNSYLTWFVETLNNVMVSIGASESNFNTRNLTLSTAHHAACQIFLSVALATVSAAELTDLTDTLCRMDELIAVSSVDDVRSQQGAMYKYCSNLQQIIKANAPKYMSTAQVEFKYYLSQARNDDATAKTTLRGYLPVSANRSSKLLISGRKYVLYDTLNVKDYIFSIKPELAYEQVARQDEKRYMLIAAPEGVASLAQICSIHMPQHIQSPSFHTCLLQVINIGSNSFVLAMKNLSEIEIYTKEFTDTMFDVLELFVQGDIKQRLPYRIADMLDKAKQCDSLASQVETKFKLMVQKVSELCKFVCEATGTRKYDPIMKLQDTLMQNLVSMIQVSAQWTHLIHHIRQFIQLIDSLEKIKIWVQNQSEHNDHKNHIRGIAAQAVYVHMTTVTYLLILKYLQAPLIILDRLLALTDADLVIRVQQGVELSCVRAKADILHQVPQYEILHLKHFWKKLHNIEFPSAKDNHNEENEVVKN